jgi:SAM-dependent methyltransferase
MLAEISLAVSRSENAFLDLPIMTKTGAYQEDLAYIHDVGFDFYARGVAPEMLKTFRRLGITKGLIVDLGCGSGIWVRELIRAGYDVLGVDISEAMIRLARKKAPEAKFIRSSFLDVPVPPCDAVTSLGECLCYLFDSKNGMTELTKLFSRIYEALRPGGLFVFDIAQPGQTTASLRVRNFTGADWAVLREDEEDGKNMVLTRRMTLFRQVGKLYRRSEETHRLRLYWAADLVRILRDIGFHARVLRGYGQYRLTGNRAALLARKP